MPLYVEGDLRLELADRVEAHLGNCSRCHSLASAYKASQSWLRSAEPPEFDDSFFNDLKHGVLKRVAEADARPSLIALLTPWNRRQMLALTAAVLVVLGTFAFYFYEARVSSKPAIPQDVAQKLHDEADKLRVPSGAVGTQEAPRASFKRPWHARRHAGLRSLNPHREQQILAEEINSSLREADWRKDSEGNSQPALRIEFQTRDPNIRIIWFAPKETDSHQSKPATD
jgi:hypothetical protein